MDRKFALSNSAEKREFKKLTETDIKSPAGNGIPAVLMTPLTANVSG